VFYPPSISGEKMFERLMRDKKKAKAGMKNE
jgi:hypothetical protein